MKYHGYDIGNEEAAQDEANWYDQELIQQAKAEESDRILAIVEKRINHLSQLMGTSVAYPVILAFKTRLMEAEAIRNQIQKEANSDG